MYLKQTQHNYISLGKWILLQTQVRRVKLKTLCYIYFLHFRTVKTPETQHNFEQELTVIKNTFNQPNPVEIPICKLVIKSTGHIYTLFQRRS